MKQHLRRNAGLLRKGLAVAAVAMLGTRAAASGLTLYEISTRDLGLASAGYSARAQDASTVMTNPAGMVRLEGTQATAGAQSIFGDIKFSQQHNVNSAGGGNGGSAVGWVPGAGAFVSHSLSPVLKIGFGLGGNFGLAEEYDRDWVGRYYGREATLLGLSLLPSVAFRLNDRLSVGATVNAMYGIMKTKVAVNNALPGVPDGELKLDDRTWGWGVNLGLLYELTENTRFGLTYTSQIDLDFKPNAEFTGLGPGLNAALANRRLLNAELNLGVKVPQSVMASVVHQVDSSWTVLGSVGWQEWSKFGRIDVGIEGNDLKETELNFKNAWHAALGAQYRASDVQTYDFGIAYDAAFQDRANLSPLLATNSVWRFGVGVHNQVDKRFSWGVAAEYYYTGTLDLNKRSNLPPALGGRGDLVGSYNNAGMVFLSAHANWKF